jgi:hypothetical protein
VLAVEERAQQPIKAPAVVGIHGSKLDAHSLTWGDATDDASCADFHISGGENQFNEASFWGRISSADKQAAESDVIEAGDGALSSYLPTDKSSIRGFDARVTPCGGLRI